MDYDPTAQCSGQAIDPREYIKQQVAAQGYGATNVKSQIRNESELESITSRVHRMATGMEETAAKLRLHADAIYGPVPEANECGTAQDARCGQLGSLYDAFDRLERIHSAVAIQAGRNCTLA